jgi:hypothetical protein
LVAPIVLAPAAVPPVVVAALPIEAAASLPEIRYIAAEVPEELGALKMSLVNGGINMPAPLVLAQPAAPIRVVAPVPVVVEAPVPPQPVVAPPPAPARPIAVPARPPRRDRN